MAAPNLLQSMRLASSGQIGSSRRALGAALGAEGYRSLMNMKTNGMTAIVTSDST